MNKGTQTIDAFLQECAFSRSIEIGTAYRAGFRAGAKGRNLLPGLILDRDGVVVEEVNYLSRREDVHILHGVFDLLRWARDMGLPTGVATNQAGIDRRYFSWSEYRQVIQQMENLLAAGDVSVDAIVACPFHPQYTKGYCEDHAYWRKPGPGMMHILSQRLSLDLARSWLIGDNVTDISAAKASGMAGAIHVLTGHGARYRKEALSLNSPAFAVVACEDLHEALKFLKGCNWSGPISAP